ncbi:hypothetical protein G6M89_19965 [Natronolimnobius sp. AArcel1]|uniref:hypothetical protein n=1 Tax=Natronolimnobius sp. AArcel1 TaxID=1679093 RepID=UPI0013EAA4BB|nr:hypothetical protein [Natronolimnobius sp. AArcel1]NGM71251.1 hypothetical protein [Natronolimnobius sp. AArcel1]
MSRTTLNLTFAIGFLAAAAGILIARANPATGYEPSVYLGTPTAVWVGFAIAMAIGVGTAIACRGHYQAIGIGLGSLVATSIVALPILRNYRFSGMGDALSHLGWTRDIVEGGMYPHDLLYPGVHSIGVVFHFLGGISIERALLFTILLLFIPFLIFVPLTVREIAGPGAAVGFAAVVSWMVLPINNIATHMGVHSNSNALFLAPVVIFALVAYLNRQATIERLPFGLSPFSVVLYLSAFALLLVHPQQMVNIVVLVGAIAGVQFLARRRYDDHPILEQPTTYAHTAVLGGFFTVWAASNERFRNAIVSLVDGVLADDVGTEQEVDQREASLLEIGGSIEELFVTMFLEAAIIGLIVGLFVLAMWLGWTNTTRATASHITYLGLALIPLGGIFLVYFVGTPTMAFRQVGFIYVILTIIAGVALAHLFGGLSGYITRPGANTVAALALGAFLVLGLMTVYASPIIYSPSQHITEQKFSGYESGFEHAAEERPHVGMGYDPYRYDHGINGLDREDVLSGATHSSGEIDPEQFEAGNYSGAYHDSDYYFTVTEFDVTRETQVYQGLHHSEEALEGIQYDPAADKVISNDEFDMYAVASDE